MTLKTSAVLATAMFLAACGDNGGGAGGSGGEGGAATTTTATHQGGAGGHGGDDPGGEGGGGGAPCNITGDSCQNGEYCDFGDDSCGASGVLGTCRPHRWGCEALPTCACDGTVYTSACVASALDQDVSASGGCELPAGTFACGYTFCAIGQQYCQRAFPDGAGGGPPSSDSSGPYSYSCGSLPAGCAACDCLVNEPCGSTCEQLPGGDLQLTCPGG